MGVVVCVLVLVLFLFLRHTFVVVVVVVVVVFMLLMRLEVAVFFMLIFMCWLLLLFHDLMVYHFSLNCSTTSSFLKPILDLSRRF